MTTFIENRTETYHVISCYHCGLYFGIPNQLYKRVVTDAEGSIYCPACKGGFGWRESDDAKKIKALEKKLQWEAEESAKQNKRAINAESSLRATKGVVTKLKRRGAAGTCPCCKRTFKQLTAHMKKKHPEFVEKAKKK